jgi:hypothetical protein
VGFFDKKKKPSEGLPTDGKALVTQDKKEIMEMNSAMVAKLVLKGDLSAMSQTEKVEYYNIFCNNLGLNPVTRPFEIITFKGKETLYARKDATDQLRKINKVSVYDLRSEKVGEDIYKVIPYGIDGSGRKDVGTGVIAIQGLKGENLANAIMKAETKAKRRLTLSLCGLGIMDESEMGDTPMHDVTPEPEALSYEEIKKASQTRNDPKGTESIEDVNESIVREEVKDTPSPESPDAVFKDIMAIVNGKSLTSQQKMDTIKEVMPIKGNLAELKKVLAKIQ